jgi:acetyl-CoA carboxylase biotin carboxyl carrier protein
LTAGNRRNAIVTDQANTVRASVPGIFYRRPDPNSEVYVNPGDEVQPGTVVGVVEVMKQFHEIRTEQAGRIGEFLVDNEETVAVGQPIVALEET